MYVFQEPSYRERAEKLIGEVKEMFNSMPLEDGESMSPLNDLIQRLWMVDSVERLGIDRHFKKEIKSALDYVYRSVALAFSSLFIHALQEILLACSYWNEKGIGIEFFGLAVI